MSDTQKNFYKKFLGDRGERAAVGFLKKSGYKRIKRNFVTPFGEADAIAEKDGVTVFIEVKTRTNGNFGEPKDAVDAKKKAKYIKIAEYYMNRYGAENVSFAVAEVADGQVTLIENAF